MSYVDKTLIAGEQVVYRASLQRLRYLWLIVPVAGLVLAGLEKAWRWAAAAAVVGLLLWLATWLRLRSAEFAVTNKRVIIKTGVLNRRTVETMLSKVEGISVDQPLLGRICNYGTVTITGTGGTRESFDDIADPLEFRRQVQTQLARLEDARGPAPVRLDGQ
jgi:uncharacterized membrane protein YdbT with pleckstrin-like domain